MYVGRIKEKTLDVYLYICTYLNLKKSNNMNKKKIVDHKMKKKLRDDLKI